MRILFVSAYFPPEIGAAQTRTYELAERLVGLGHSVHVLTTFPNYPTGIVPPEWKGHLLWKGLDNGIHITRVWSYAVPNRGFLKRILGHLSFALMSVAMAPLLPKVDVIIMESHPLFNGLAAICISRMKGAPYIFNVSDLWPQSAIEMGVLHNRLLIWLAKRVELISYRCSALILAMSAGIRSAIIDDAIDPAKVVLFTNAVDLSLFSPSAADPNTRKQLGIGSEEFVVMYAGTLGMAHGLATVLEAAKQLQREGHTSIRLVLVGEGAEREGLQARAAQLGLNNVLFLPPVAKARLPQLLTAANCILVSLKDLWVFYGVLPTKLLEAMACARPVLLAVGGEAAQLLDTAKAGVSVKPGDAKDIHDGILRLANDRNAGRRMGLNGREYMQLHFSREVRAKQLCAYMDRLVHPPTRPAQAAVRLKELRDSDERTIAG